MLRLDVECVVMVEARAAHVIHDADSEVIFRRLGRKLVEHGFRHGWGELFGRKAESPADDVWHGGRLSAVRRSLHERSDHILVEWLADTARFFGSVENRDCTRALWKRREKVRDREGAIEVHANHTYFLATLVQIVDCLFQRFRTRAHEYDNTLGFVVSVIVE